MSIEIKVTGASLPEVADKLLAIGQSLLSGTIVPYSGDPDTAADKPKAASRKTKPKAEQAPEPVTVNDDVQDAAGDAGAAETQTDRAEPAAQTTSTPDAPSDAPSLDFDKDVAPVVIEAVQRTSREAVTAVLSEFGAERASEVAEGLWPELVERLKALS